MSEWLTTDKKSCDVCGRDNGRIHYSHKANKMLCRKHYEQFQKFGEFKDDTSRTIHDKNDFKIKGNIVEIYTYDRYGINNGVVLIDTEDLEMVMRYKWHKHKQGYACANIGGKLVKMQNLLIDCPKGLMRDHINGNRLDNTKKNLRVCTPAENGKNKQAKGVTKKFNKWEASICSDYKKHYLGLFDTKEEAEKAYQKKAIELFGEFARCASN